jgi:hypothetical protein
MLLVAQAKHRLGCKVQLVQNWPFPHTASASNLAAYPYCEQTLFLIFRNAKKSIASWYYSQSL